MVCVHYRLCATTLPYGYYSKRESRKCSKILMAEMIDYFEMERSICSVYAKQLFISFFCNYVEKIFQCSLNCDIDVKRCLDINPSAPAILSLTHTHTHKADELSRTGPSSSSSIIHQHSTLWPAHPIEQPFILSILEFPPQSFFQARLGLFTMQHAGHVGSISQCCVLAHCDLVK